MLDGMPTCREYVSLVIGVRESGKEMRFGKIRRRSQDVFVRWDRFWVSERDGSWSHGGIIQRTAFAVTRGL